MRLWRQPAPTHNCSSCWSNNVLDLSLMKMKLCSPQQYQIAARPPDPKQCRKKSMISGSGLRTESPSTGALEWQGALGSYTVECMPQCEIQSPKIFHNVPWFKSKEHKNNLLSSFHICEHYSKDTAVRRAYAHHLWPDPIRTALFHHSWPAEIYSRNRQITYTGIYALLGFQSKNLSV
jgi:hypothetical protein